jgi:hypothetical protein
MPSSPNYKRNLKQEYANQVKRGETKVRAKRNKARRAAMKKGLVKKGDGKDIDHSGRRATGKTRVLSKSANRSHGGKVGNRAGKAAGARKANASKRRKK